jgi:hypothetical protein
MILVNLGGMPFAVGPPVGLADANSFEVQLANQLPAAAINPLAHHFANPATALTSYPTAATTSTSINATR